jgi:hypothetical protein
VLLFHPLGNTQCSGADPGFLEGGDATSEKGHNWHPLGIRFYVFPSCKKAFFFWRNVLVLCNERLPFLEKIVGFVQ